MNHADVSAMMRGMAPVIRDLIAAAVKPFEERILALEAQIKAFDPTEIIRSIVSDAVSAIPPASPGKDGDPGKDADPADLARMVKEAVEALPVPKDGEPGKDADPEVIAALVSEKVTQAVAALPPPQAGKDADPATIEALVSAAVVKLPPPAPGKDADPQLIRQFVAEAIAELPAPPPGKDGAPGKMPAAKEFAAGVHYETDVVIHKGATYQAIKDTANEPPHADWVCLAAAGRDGLDGRSFTIRGTYAPANSYQELDVVTLNGGAFVAKSDEPGECPGPGWQLIASQGKAGKPGERGMPGRGDRGEPGQPVVAGHLNDEGLLTLTNGDGSTVEVDFYPVLEKVAGR